MTMSSTTLSTTALQSRLARTETGKGLRLMWRRRSMTFTGIVLAGVNYLGFSLFIGGGHLVKPLMVLTLPAMLAATIANVVSIGGSGGIAEEINGGTLEQAQLGPAAPLTQLLGRTTALAAEGLAAALVLGVLFVAAVGLDYHPNPAALVPALLTIVDALGYGMLIIALTVRVASIGAITHVFNMVIIAFGGMMVPIAVLGHGLETFARLVPTALGVQALNATLSGAPLSVIWSDGTLPWLLAHTAVLTGLGPVTYVVNIRRARRRGGLSPR